MVGSVEWCSAEQLCLCLRVCGEGNVCQVGLAEEVGLQIEPLQDVLRHAQNGIHRLNLLVAKKRKTCNSKQSVERIHLQRGKPES